MTMLLDLLRKCVLGDNAAVTEFMMKTRNDVRRAFFSSMKGVGFHYGFDEFADWFSGWLVRRKKFSSLLKWAEKRQDQGEKPNDKVISGCLVRMIRRWALPEFGSEQMRRQEVGLPTNLEDGGTESPLDVLIGQERLESVRRELIDWDVSDRVLFVLYYYRALGPLDNKDLHWISKLPQSRVAGFTPACIRDEIDKKEQQEWGKECPLGVDFIGPLLGLIFAINGTYDYVRKRLSRLRERLCEQVGEHSTRSSV